ncbi:hypothetical protein OZX60_03360 [Streptococcaceae bacterium ESL0687]|nr:hypothetical protein OZX60_03360 [Streptococcaceae bacterium ESL0687]
MNIFYFLTSSSLSLDDILAYIDSIITILVAIISATAAVYYTGKPQKQVTERRIFESCYSKIYTLVEDLLFYEDLTLEETQELGKKILAICEKADNYYHPFIKVYAHNLIDATADNYQKEWLNFSQQFSTRYDRNCRQIGIPLRNYRYRILKGHLKNKPDIIFLIFKNYALDLVFLILLILLILFQIYRYVHL